MAAPTLPKPKTKADLVEHMVAMHGFSRLDMERRRHNHLARTHEWRHSVPAGETLSDSFGNDDYGQRHNLHDH
jgi:hypothetical protein